MMSTGRIAMPAVKLFLSWAHADQVLKEDLVSRLTPRLKNVKRHDFARWEDSHILAGVEWSEEIGSRFDESDYVIQLVSPAFLASDFIRDHEIPGRGKTPHKPTLPLMLKNVPLNGDYEFHGIDKHQIFFLRGANGKPRVYGDLGRDAQKDRFANEFVNAIIRCVDKRGGYR
ncbi:TIR domain-containing protein [Schaalia cardiffensis]|jgi:hypothetical protein|uniref:TIR domain-containing protein n=1 Tax=Schaalia cardiffensis TaxID=181487 RepID=UPI002AAF1614|nr:TIR domain-containing protein [Schaalia cardiffensis]